MDIVDNAAPKARRDRSMRPALDVRVSKAEKQAYKSAAELAGLPLAVWVRQHLRRALRSELETAGKIVPEFDEP